MLLLVMKIWALTSKHVTCCQPYSVILSCEQLWNGCRQSSDRGNEYFLLPIPWRTASWPTQWERQILSKRISSMCVCVCVCVCVCMWSWQFPGCISQHFHSSHPYCAEELNWPGIQQWIHNKNKLHGLSPRANYTDRATAACRRSDCQLLR
jgi:hypothetical protein